MGDRGNLFFVDGKAGGKLAGVYMYTHWSGSALPALVKAALARGRGRWGDSQYLARIVFCELVQDSVLDETGYGLGTQIGDNEHAIIRIDDTRQRVSIHRPGREAIATDKGLGAWTYEQFLTADVDAVFAPESESDDDDDDDAADAAPVALPKAKLTKRRPAKAKTKAKKPAASKRKAPTKQRRSR
jgi:hypothetical protein